MTARSTSRRPRFARVGAGINLAPNSTRHLPRARPRGADEGGRRAAPPQVQPRSGTPARCCSPCRSPSCRRGTAPRSSRSTAATSADVPHLRPEARHAPVRQATRRARHRAAGHAADVRGRLHRRGRRGHRRGRRALEGPRGCSSASRSRSTTAWSPTASIFPTALVKRLRARRQHQVVGARPLFPRVLHERAARRDLLRHRRAGGLDGARLRAAAGEPRRDARRLQGLPSRGAGACSTPRPRPRKWAMLEREPFRQWSQGPVVLMGDACHPTTPHMGQGAGMALEDAVVLVRCLESANQNLAAGLPPLRGQPLRPHLAHPERVAPERVDQEGHGPQLGVRLRLPSRRRSAP